MTKTIETIPNSRMGQITKMLEALKDLGDESDRDGIAFAMGVKKKSVNTPIAGGSTLGLIQLDEKVVRITKFGSDFLDSDDEQRRKMIGQFLSEHEPFTTILRALKRGPLSKEDIIKYVKAKMISARTWKPTTENEMFNVIRNWCEFGDLIEFNSDADTYSQR